MLQVLFFKTELIYVHKTKQNNVEIKRIILARYMFTKTEWGEDVAGKIERNEKISHTKTACDR